MSLRKEKAARLKLSVLDHTLKLIGKKSFHDLYVDEICEKVKISKVTIFKYFPQKDEILLYYSRIWSLQRAVELKDKPLEGMQGIIYLFDKLSDAYEEHPGIIMGLCAYLADMRRSLKPFPVKAEEKKILFPDREDIQTMEIQSVDQMLEKFTLEAIFKKEIATTTSARDVSHLLSSLFYGGIIASHINQVAPVKMFFRKNIELLMKGVQ